MSDDSNPHPSPAASASPSEQEKTARWERETLEKLVFANLSEQRAKRRWSIFFRSCFLILFLFVVFRMYDWEGGEFQEGGRHTATISIDGLIESDGAGAAAIVLPALNRAFSDDNAAGIILRINSPGGSPVQAGIISDEIRRLKKLHPKKKLYVVVDEMCASAGYYVAVTADRIYVDKASVVGSIGVLMDSFGFTGIMEKVGVERRMVTAGEHKGILDPYSPMSAKDKAFAQNMVNEIHQQFIEAVRQGRGKRLHETPDMFSGLFWSGNKAIELGLADGLGTVESVARDVFKAEDLIDYTQHEDFSDRLLKRFGAAFGASMNKNMRAESRLRLH
ncbi:MAG: S49 family peptidase [Burkholderiales bacterium]|nr:S49 family peptidase [Burkholderiales bacterium]